MRRCTRLPVVCTMSWTTVLRFTFVVVAPSVPQSMSRCFSCPPGSKVMRKQSPNPCRYIRTRTLGVAAIGFSLSSSMHDCEWLAAVQSRSGAEVRGSQSFELCRRELLLARFAYLAVDVLAHAVSDAEPPQIDHKRRAAFERHLGTIGLIGIAQNRALLQNAHQKHGIDVSVGPGPQREPGRVHLETVPVIQSQKRRVLRAFSVRREVIFQPVVDLPSHVALQIKNGFARGLLPVSSLREQERHRIVAQASEPLLQCRRGLTLV